MARTLNGNSADPYRCKIKRNHPLGAHHSAKKGYAAQWWCLQTNTYQVSHINPTTLKFSWLPPAPTGYGWACRFHGCNYSWNNFWQISGSRVLKDPHLNTLKITPSPCGCREPFIILSFWNPIFLHSQSSSVKHFYSPSSLSSRGSLVLHFLP